VSDPDYLKQKLQREPIDVDAIPSLDRLLAWPHLEPAKITNAIDSVAEIAPIQMTTEELAVARTPKNTDETPKLTVNKITYAQVGLISEPGRYMFRFGWLTITAEDLAIWKQFPAAAFTMISFDSSEDGEEYRLGSFDIGSWP
jgi:hypothetical protein